MTRIQLNFLPTFVAVAQLENLRAAAEALHLTHSAVSQQIGEIENRLGFPLFDRRGRRIHLNAAGQALLRQAAPALALVEDGLKAAAAAAGAAQSLRITMLPSFAQRWFLPRLGLWRAQHPGIPIEIEASVNIVDLQREGFHAAIRTGTGPWPGLEHERLYDTPTPMVAVASPAVAQRLQRRRAGRHGARAAAGRQRGVGELVRRRGPAHARDARGVVQRRRPDAAGDRAGAGAGGRPRAAGGRRVARRPGWPSCSTSRWCWIGVQPYYLVYPPALKNWPPLIALRDWVRHEFDCSLRDASRRGRDAPRARIPLSES